MKAEPVGIPIYARGVLRRGIPLTAFCVFSLLWVLCLAVPPSFAGTLPLEGRPWVGVETESFMLYSNAEVSKAERVARDLEGLRRAMAKITRLELSSPVPTSIFVFANDGSLIPYKHLYRGEPASMSGAFYTQPYGDYIVMDGARRQEATLTVYHEYVHTVLRNNLPGLPLWLEEGLAELYSTFEIVDGRGRIGRPLQRHLKELAKGEPLSLEALLRVDAESSHYNVFEHQGEFYARSWELVHYLLLGNDERRRQMLDFLRLGFGGIVQDEAFRRAFAVDYATLEKEITAYRKEGFKTMAVELQSAELGSPKISSIAYPQILVNLGDLLVSQGDRHQDALFHFEEALRLDPTRAGAVAGMGLVAQQKRDYPRARALFRRAVEMAPKDGRLSYHYATSLLVLGRGASESKLREARLHLERCLEQNPNFAPAWARLASIYGLSKGLDDEGLGEKALEAGRMAHRLMPNREGVALQLLLLYSRTRDRVEARRLYRDYFEHHPDAESRQAAMEILRRMDWLSADSDGEPIDIVR